MRLLLALLAFALSALPMAANAELSTQHSRSAAMSSTMDYCDMSSDHDNSKRTSNCFSTVCMAIIFPEQERAASFIGEPTILAPMYDRIDLAFDAGIDPPPPRFR